MQKANVWILVQEANDYNQPPNNVVAIFDGKPSAEQISEAGLDAYGPDTCLTMARKLLKSPVLEVRGHYEETYTLKPWEIHILPK